MLRLALILIAAVAAARIIALFATPLELYPDEAQYWAWSRELAFGYFSKPPLVAWAIRATTALGGDDEPWVRLSFGLFQAGAGLLAFLIGRKLYGPAVGLTASALYVLAPGVQLSALVAATDAPLLFFLAGGLFFYVRLQGGRRWRDAALAGAALGLAFLSKYAALYALLGAAAHLALSSEARRAWSPAAIGAAAAAFVAVIAPNLLWNLGHDLATVRHTADNADWAASRFNPLEAMQFLGAQFGVIGPAPFAALLIGSGLAIRRKALSEPDLLLACFIVPPLLIVAAQAFISRANANWAAACVLPAVVLAAAWLVRWRARGWITAAIASQALMAAAFLAIVAQPALADRIGASNGFKRARGWAETTTAILDRAEREQDLTAIAVNNRFLFYALTYYGRDRLASAPPLASWLLASEARNQAETAAPLTRRLGERALLVSYEGWWRPEMQGDFARTSGLEIETIGLDRKHRRRLEMFIGEGFAPKPRDPATGKPFSAATTPP